MGWTGLAAAQTVSPSGHVGVDYARSNLEAGPYEADADSWRLDGSFAFPTSGAMNFALDAAITNFDSNDLGGSATVVGGTGHLDYRMGDTNLIGVFVGGEHNDEVNLFGGGIEGQNTSSVGGVAVQLGYGRADDLDGADFWAGRIEGRLYPTDNIRLSLNVGGTQLSGDGGDTDLYNVGATAEYQFTGMPISVWGGYERGEWNDADLSADTWRLGVRYNFGGSLRDRDAAGASLGSMSELFGGSLGSGLVAVVGEVLNQLP